MTGDPEKEAPERQKGALTYERPQMYHFFPESRQLFSVSRRFPV